ncbi:UNVERIFIED_ORG: serine/threonine-protein kinase HipA [Rahnella aquatilis]|nr:serine/threonine-protein kinase HipA [Rahnella aquatilis]
MWFAIILIIYYLISKILRRHWIKQGEQSGLGKRQIETMIDELIELVPVVIENVARQLPASFPPELADAILTGMEQQRVRLEAQV